MARSRHVLQLPDVAGPVVALEHGQGLRGDAAHLLAELLAELLEEVGDEQRDVLAALAQRRQVDRDDVEAVEEVLAHRPLRHRRLEVAVGGGDEPHVGLDVLRVADAPDLALLDGPQELDLQQRRDLGDLVEEQRAAVGRGEEAHLVGDRAGERSLHVAEQLGLHQALGDRPAVDGDERLVAPVRR